jgi:hypothetical protein
MKKPTIRKILFDMSQRLYNLELKVDRIDKRTESYPKLYDMVDKLVGEIMENRQERSFMQRMIEDHGVRIKKLERAL